MKLYRLYESQVILIESVSRARKQYLDTGEIDKSLFDKFKENFDGKHLPAVIKWYLKDPGDFNIKTVKENIERFEKNIKKVDKDWRDINRFKNVEQFEGLVGSLSKSQKEKKDEIKDESVIYESDSIIIINPKSHEQSCFWGKDTKWCITEKDSRHWDRYTSGDNVEFYFVIHKKIKDDRDPLKKIAIAKYRNNVHEGIIDYEIFNSKDELIITDDYREAFDYEDNDMYIDEIPGEKDWSEDSATYAGRVLKKFGDLFKPKPPNPYERIIKKYDKNDINDVIQLLGQYKNDESIDYHNLLKRSQMDQNYELLEYLIKSNATDNPYNYLPHTLSSDVPKKLVDIFHYVVDNYPESTEKNGYLFVSEIPKTKDKNLLKKFLNNDGVKFKNYLSIIEESPAALNYTSKEKAVEEVVKFPEYDISTASYSYNEPLIKLIDNNENDLLIQYIKHPKLDINRMKRVSSYTANESPATYAMNKGNFEAAKIIMEDPRFEIESTYNDDGVEVLLTDGGLDFLKILIEKGYDINYNNNELLWDLIRYSKKSNAIRVINYIIDYPYLEISEKGLINIGLLIGNLFKSSIPFNPSELFSKILEVSKHGLSAGNYEILEKWVERGFINQAIYFIEKHLSPEEKNDPKISEIMSNDGMKYLLNHNFDMTVDELIKFVEKYNIKINNQYAIHFFRAIMWRVIKGDEEYGKFIDYILNNNRFVPTTNAVNVLMETAVKLGNERIIDALLKGSKNEQHFWTELFFELIGNDEINKAYNVMNKTGILDDKDKFDTTFTNINDYKRNINSSVVSKLLVKGNTKGYVKDNHISRFLGRIAAQNFTDIKDNQTRTNALFKTIAEQYDYKFKSSDSFILKYAYQNKNKWLFMELAKHPKIYQSFPEGQVEKAMGEFNNLS